MKTENFFRAALTLLIMLLTATTAGAADITQNTAVVINSGNKAKYNNKSIAGNVPGTSYAGKIDWFISEGAIVVDGIELNLTIDGFHANYSDQYAPLSGISLVNGAKLHLTVKGVNTLTAGYGGAGIAVPFGCSLEITAASTGTLNATGGKYYGGGAGIGSRGNCLSTSSQNNQIFPQGCGDITINGGTINAKGGTWYFRTTASGGAAGIGSSEYSGWTVSGITFGDNTYVNNITGNITINGGTVNATGGRCAAGIGGGCVGTVKTITINGGNVTATAGEDAAAIGSGYNAAAQQEDKLTCATISITGGSVTANGNIGYGNALYAGTNVGGSVTIGSAAALDCTGTISPSTQRFTNHTFRITVYDASLTATVSNELIQLPAGKTAYCDLQMATPGIGTATLDVLYPDDQLAGSGMLTVRGFTSEALSLSESIHDVGVGGYCYAFSGTIFDTRIALGTTATMTLDDVSGIYANTTYTPDKAGTATDAGVARFSGYFITPTELSGEQTFRVTDSNNNAYTSAVTFPAVEAHKSNLGFIVSDGSVVSEVTYIDENHTEQTCSSFQIANNTAWGDVGTESWLVVNSDFTFDERITVHGTVNLILCDNASLKAEKGINVSEGNCLNIYGQQDGTGRLTAFGGKYEAGIGSGESKNGGTVRIYGGTVTATGGDRAAGIGSGGNYSDSNHHGGTIEISGGTISAIGGYRSAGIGGGYNCDGGTITISGGTVYAKSTQENSGAGIGGGGGMEHISAGTITITGGGAGTITITGGNITAKSEGKGTGIGTGYGGSGGTVTLGWTKATDAIYAKSYGGTVTLSSNFVLQGTNTEATTGNIGGNTIVPCCTISFSAGEGRGRMDGVAVAAGATYQLPKCTFTAPDESKVFYRWQIGTAEYEPGDKITVDGNLSVTALWGVANCTVTIKMNDHGEDITETVPYGGVVSAPKIPIEEIFDFAGWYVGETPYDFNTPVTHDIEVTARWSTKVEVENATLTVNGTYTYTGLRIIPSVTVKIGDTVVPRSEYSVASKNSMMAGIATVGISDNIGGDYDVPKMGATFVVNPQPVTVSGITAKNKVADGNTSVEIDCSHAVFSGIVRNDELTVSATGAFADAEAGEGKTVSISGLTLGGKDAGNYVLAAEGQQATATATIYAPHTVTFADEYGTVLDGFPVETILNGAKATDPTTDANRPAKDGYRFVGWNNGSEAFDFDTPLDFETTTTLTLTAHFLKLHSVAGATNPSTGSGTIAIDKTVAVAGEELTVTVSPNKDKELAYLNIYYTEDGQDTAIPYTMTGVNEAKFTMPDKDNVHVVATFTLSSNLLAGLKNDQTGYYEVTKAADLVLIGSWMAADHTMENETILLMNDINVSGSGFTSFPYSLFKGTFDGDGHTISGISISTSGDAGLFGSLGGTVKDLTVIGSVKGSGSTSIVGGIACTVQSTGKIQNCVSLVEVTSGNEYYTGGVAGLNYGTVSGCHYLGNGVSGAVGTYIYNVAATDCTALYAVVGSDDENIGIATVGTTTSNGTIYGGCYHEAGSEVTMALTAGSKDGWTLSGYKYQVYNESTYAYDDVNLTANGNGTYTLTVPSEDVTLLPNYRYSALTMQQDEQNRYLVTSVADLNEVAALTSALDGCLGMTFLLANDIEFGEDDSFGGIAVGLTDEYGYDAGFNGTFDGGGHTIYGMNIESKAKNLGFIGYLTGTLQNLTLEYCTVNNISDAENSYAGMLVGDGNQGNISHCRVIGGEVNGANAGAIFGRGDPEAKDNLYSDEVVVVSGDATKAPGTCGTSGGDRSYYGSNAAVVGWRVIFLDDSGQLAPAQLVADGDAATKPEVNPAPRAHFTFTDTWKWGNSGEEYTFDQREEADNITANTTLYSIWDEETKYTVSYSGNGGSGNDVSEQVYASEVSAFRLPECFYDAPEGSYFSTWRIGGTDYAPGAAVDFSDDITVMAQWARNAFELADNADNSTVLAAYSGKVADVTLQDRTLYKDGDWNTLCLPFDVSITSGTLSDDNVVAMTLNSTTSNLNDGTLTLNFDAVATTGEQAGLIPAGTPFIIKWASKESPATDLVNPVFSGVTIDNSAEAIARKTVTFGGVSFVGTYNPVIIPSGGDNTKLYLGANNTLYWPNDAMTIGAFRAYFQLTEDAQAFSRFVLNFGDEDETQGINSLTPDPSPRGEGSIYTLDGVKLDKMPTRKGVYIMNGRKVVVK